MIPDATPQWALDLAVVDRIDTFVDEWEHGANVSIGTAMAHLKWLLERVKGQLLADELASGPKEET